MINDIKKYTFCIDHIKNGTNIELDIGYKEKGANFMATEKHIKREDDISVWSKNCTYNTCDVAMLAINSIIKHFISNPLEEDTIDRYFTIVYRKHNYYYCMIRNYKNFADMRADIYKISALRDIALSDIEARTISPVSEKFINEYYLKNQAQKLIFKLEFKGRGLNERILLHMV